ncbi:hypothetical protein [Piscinibacter gummiphilus]|uniref:Uncharacterized protein n=1 Tax=Piscinibacter gummiphilus TaxID=946333 RepID=A0ABZ0CUP3_9BURK|nr:hypothetical protein [Piscinibacter gummiphilus]WOB06851.1 hypothetical protein RXV79_18235 [Piscinibacter gummiphilus]
MAIAAKYEALLGEALEIAKRKAESKPQIVRDILATGTVEGLASKINRKAAAVSFRAEKYKRTWHAMTPWQYLEHTTAEEEAESIIQTVEDNIHMTETKSWPALPENHK